MKPDFPEDPASVVRSQLKTWMAELEVLSRDPRVRKFAELRQKIETADAWYRLGSPGQGEIGGNQTRSEGKEIRRTSTENRDGRRLVSAWVTRTGGDRRESDATRDSGERTVRVQDG